MDHRTDRKMTDSGVEWIGQMPDGWQTVHFKDVAGFHVGKTPNTGVSANFDGGIPWITISDLTERGEFPQHTNTTISLTGVASSGIRKAVKGSLLVSFKLSIGKVAIAAEDVYTNEAVAAVNASKKCLNKFLFWALPVSMLNEATENIYGAKIYNQDQLGRAVIPLPSLPLQQAIANYLDHHVGLIDEGRSLISKKIELLKEQRSTLIFEVVTGKRTLMEAQHLAGVDDWSDIIGSGPVVAVPTPRADDSFVKSGRLMDSGVEWIGEIPDGWKVDRIKNLTSKIQSGRTPVDMERVTSADGIPWITISDMSSGQIREDKATRIIPGSAGPEAKSGDVLYSIYATIGVAAGPITSRVATNQAILSLRPVGNGRYMKYSLDAVRPFMLQAALSNTQANLSTGAVRQIFLPSPSPDLQQEIAEFLDYETGLIDKEIELLTAKNELLSAKRKALIFEAVTGKIEING